MVSHGQQMQRIWQDLSGEDDGGRPTEASEQDVPQGLLREWATNPEPRGGPDVIPTRCDPAPSVTWRPRPPQMLSGLAILCFPVLGCSACLTPFSSQGGAEALGPAMGGCLLSVLRGRVMQEKQWVVALF